MHPQSFSKTNCSALLQTFTWSTKSGRSKGGCNFGIILHINVLKCYRGEVRIFWQKRYMWKPVGTLPIWFLLKPIIDSCKSDTITARPFWQAKYSEERKKLKFTSHLKDLVLRSSLWTSVVVFEVIWHGICSSVERKKTSETEICLQICLHKVSHDIQSSDWVQHCWLYEHSFAAFFYFYFEDLFWEQDNHWAVHKRPDNL